MLQFTKIVAIDEIHAKAINAHKEFKSAVCGRAVIVALPSDNVLIPALTVEAVGYTDEVSDWDINFLENQNA